MKKFLLTLLTLFMASSLFAEEYLYVDNVNVVKTKLGTATVKIPVKAHFDDAVSAWQLRITMPEGMTTSTWEEGEDLTIEYYNQNGKLKDLDAGVTTHDNINFVCITSATTSGYYQVDGAWVSYGPVKWLGSEEDYEEMLILTVDVAADFTGGVITVETAPSCGRDDRPDVTPCESHSLETDPYVKTAEVTVEYIAPEPVMTWNPETYTMTLSVPEGYDAHDFVLYANGSQVQLDENNSYTVEQTDEDQKIVFTAYTVHDDTETYDSNDATYGKLTEYEEVTVPAKEVLVFEGTASVVFNENVATLTYTSNDPNATVVVKVDGTEKTVEWTKNEETGEYTATYTVEKSDVPGEHSVTVELTVTPSDNYTGEAVSDNDTYTYYVNDELKGDINISDPDENGKVTVTYTGDEDGVELTVVVKDKDGEVVEATFENGVLQLPDYGEYTVEVTAKAEGYNDKDADKEVTWEKKDLAGTIVVSEPDENGKVTVTYTPGAGDPEVTITVNGEPVAESYQLEDGVPMTFNVIVSADGYNDMTAEETRTWTKPAVTPTPEITVTRDESFYYVKATGNGEVKLYIDGEEVVLRADSPEAKLAREEDDYTVTATATAKEEGKLISETATKDVLVKALVDEPEKPEIKLVETLDDNDIVTSTTITIEAPEDTPDDAEIWYKLDDGEWQQYADAITVDDDGKHTIEAKIVVKDTDANVEPNSIDVESEVEKKDFEIGVGTNVNELVNGKQIAGVRYFNMAGQEMQEANGITIVVTTYTDGTTSTVKVMK